LLNGVMIPENPALYTVRNILHSYGSTHAIEALQRSLAAFRLKTKYDGEILLWDMSVKQGGRFGPHHSHRSGRDVPIGIMNVANVGDIRDVGDVSHVSDVRDVHSTNVFFPAVIPRKVRFARSEREPGRQTGHPDTNAH